MGEFSPFYIMKHYFYVGIYDLVDPNDESIRIASKFSGVIEVEKTALPGPVYSAIIEEWYTELSKVFNDRDYKIKIVLEKLELIL